MKITGKIEEDLRGGLSIASAYSVDFDALTEREKKFILENKEQLKASLALAVDRMCYHVREGRPPLEC